MSKNQPHILVIAGMDPSGNAGIIRDVQIAFSLGVRASVAVTALTAQNRKSFISTKDVGTRTFEEELSSVAPLSQYRAIKIGMLGNEKNIQTLLRFLKKQKKKPPIILDPVYESSTGGALLTQRGRKALWNDLLPEVSLWTPNVDEAAFFSKSTIRTAKDLEKVAEQLWEKKKVPLLIKGRLTKTSVEDLFYNGHEKSWFVFPRQNRRGLRGTGCALSSLIASHVAWGYSIPLAVRQARSAMDAWMKTEARQAPMVH